MDKLKKLNYADEEWAVLNCLEILFSLFPLKIVLQD